VKPGHMVPVADFSPDTLRSVVAHLEVSTTFEHFVFREAELGALWSLTEFANGDVLADNDVMRLRQALLQAYDLLGRKRPLEAIRSLLPFAGAEIPEDDMQ
jgi:hypothetical protein